VVSVDDLADVLIREQGKPTCESCAGANHRPSEMLWFRSYAMRWLCEACDIEPRIYGTGFSGGCNDDTRNGITPYCGDKTVKYIGSTEGNHRE